MTSVPVGPCSLHEFRKNGVRFVFGTHKDLVTGIPPFDTTESVNVAEVGAIAWFCNFDFESVALFYGAPLHFIE